MSVLLKGIDVDQDVVKIPTDALAASDAAIPAVIGDAMASSTKLKEGDEVLIRWRDVNGTFDAATITIVGVFENTAAELPALTTGLIATSDFLVNYWPLVIVGAAAIGWLGWWVLQKEGPRRNYHSLLLRLPIIGRLTRGVNTARFTRTLSILAGSGVPILEALKISAEVIENLPMRDAVTEATVRVREGAGISKSLAASKLFPPMMIHLVSSGEAGGRLEEMLARSASGQEREVDGLIAALLGILQPLLIVAMGAIVMVIVLAILLPIFEINNLIL